MLPDNKLDQFSKPGLVVEGITFHNNGSFSSTEDRIKDLLSTEDTHCCHFTVDQNRVVQLLPLDRWATHTGLDGCAGDKNTIAIEILSNISDEIYLEAQTKAIEFAKELMVHYSLKKSQIYFHNDFNQFDHCPNDIMRIYGSKLNFIKEEF